jgi:hypothetical protein
MLRRLQFLISTITFVGLAVTLSNPASSIEPEHKLGTWLGVTSKHRYTDRWSLFLQGEVRTWQMLHNLNEVLWRVAGHYDFSKSHMGAVGYVRVDTFPYTSGNLRKFYENRIFQEWLINTKLGSGKIDNRFRLEQRWITTPEFGRSYSNRVRYKLGYTHTIKYADGQPGKWFLKAFNEVFIDLDKNGYWFDLQGGKLGLNQNRLYVGGGRKIGQRSNLQLGAMWQHRPDSDFGRLLLTYSPNFDFRPQKD